jgi:hypothetical protein
MHHRVVAFGIFTFALSSLSIYDYESLHCTIHVIEDQMVEWSNGRMDAFGCQLGVPLARA